jgi:chemotaxis protein methyltransferase CheR
MTLGVIDGPSYRQIVEIVYRNSRINLGNTRQQLVVARLAKRCRELGLANFEAYCNLLAGAEGPDEIAMLVDLISTNHTGFFRETCHFESVTSVMLPAFFAQADRNMLTVRCWCAASSSGEEPFSLAITLQEFARNTGAFRWRVEATDISRRMIALARAGIYPEKKLGSLPPGCLERYFHKGIGVSAGLRRVRDSLKANIVFHAANLFQDKLPVMELQHVIFCRNVMIYFDRASQQQLLNRLAAQLLPGGYLVLGLSESLLGLDHSLRSLGFSVYRKEK